MGGHPVAVLIDGENVAATHADAIMARAAKLGEPLARCVVGDFSGARLDGWTKAAPRHGLELVFQLSCGKGKNSADIALAIRAMDWLAQGVFRSFLIVSSDNDFAPLAVRLGRSGVGVYGMGRTSEDSAWRNACTGFFELEPKAPAQAKPPAQAQTGVPAALPSAAGGTASASTWSETERATVRDILRRAAADGSSLVGLSQLGLLVRQESKDLGARLGKGRLLKNLRADPSFGLQGEGSSMKVRLKQPVQAPPS